MAEEKLITIGNLEAYTTQLKASIIDPIKEGITTLESGLSSTTSLANENKEAIDKQLTGYLDNEKGELVKPLVYEEINRVKAELEETMATSIAKSVTSVYRVMGSRSREQFLEILNEVKKLSNEEAKKREGEVYNISEDCTIDGVSIPAGSNLVIAQQGTSTGWDKLSETFNFSDYIKVAEADAKYATKADLDGLATGTSTTMNNYFVTTKDFNTFKTDVSDKHVYKDVLEETLKQYVKTDALNTFKTEELSKYVLSSTLDNYVTKVNLSSTLGGYVTSEDLSSTLEAYTKVGDYVETSEYTSKMDEMRGYIDDSFVGKSDFDNKFKNEFDTYKTEIANTYYDKITSDGLFARKDDYKLVNTTDGVTIKMGEEYYPISTLLKVLEDRIVELEAKAAKAVYIEDTPTE